jgi:N-acyl-D-aspartate/D-glutamate deacylase
MKALVERGMKDGAVGLSSGLEYDPGFYATTDELTALATAIKPYGGIYSSHVRDEENEYIAAWTEAIEVGRRAGVAVEISHMKLASKPVWGRAKEGLALLDAARREGLTVMGDWYPYPYWQSAMYVLIPGPRFRERREVARGPRRDRRCRQRADHQLPRRPVLERQDTGGTRCRRETPTRRRSSSGWSRRTARPSASSARRWTKPT